MSNKFGNLALNVDQPSRMVLIHPITQQPLRDHDGKEAFIELYSGDSSAAQKHERAVQQRRIDMRRGTKLTMQEIEAEAIEFLAALTVSWYLVDLEGEPINAEFSLANARELYSEPGLRWLREQVNLFAGDRGNFSKASSIN